ncbi:transglutaminase-like domain-containing protein [Streptomyces sp. TRM70308]|uniref:transglutaminase family protein n=1 Tax=Streptomyces sp. TRM70308 TaxID=3131932 RepID=UPI003CFDF30A
MPTPKPQPTPGDDAELRERFARAARAERPDLALLCLLVSAAGDEEAAADGIDALVDTAQIELDRLTGLLPFAPRRTPREWADALATLLGERAGFHGTAGDYERLDSSLLSAVLRRRRGLPILLSVVWLEVARRAGAPVHGVALPGHFVVGFGEPGGADQVLVDPFAGGRVLSAEDASALVSGATGTPLTPAMLHAADPVDVVLRVLGNIRAWAAGRPERGGVRLWAVELSLLLPHHPAQLRYERARLLVERGAFLAGADALEEYAALVADVEPEAARGVRDEARAARARLN